MRLVLARIATAVILLLVGLASGAVSRPASKGPRVGYVSPGARHAAGLLRLGVLLAPALALWLTVVSIVTAPSAHAQEIVTLATRSRVTQSYFLARVPEKPEAIAILFPGSGGDIRSGPRAVTSSSARATS